jgi:hypothetical protein
MAGGARQGRCVIPLTEAQEAIIGRGLSALPLALRDEAQKYIADRLRPIRELTDADVRHAICAALQRHHQ